MEDRQVKVYLTRTEDIDVTKEARRQFADWVGADLYLEIGLSSDPENTSVYGISGEYNDEYYIPEFGNLQWADCVTRQVTVAASNRAVGLFPATEEDVLWEIAIPSARISLGYVTNAAERQLLIQEDYQKSLHKVLRKLLTRFILIRNDGSYAVRSGICREESYLQPAMPVRSKRSE